MSENVDSERTSETTIDSIAALLMFGMVLIPTFIYTVRSIRAFIVTALQVLCPAWIGAILLPLIATAIYSRLRMAGVLKSRRTNALTLAFGFVIAVIVALNAPIPLTTEQVYFYQHIEEFRHQVTLMKQKPTSHQFEHFIVGVNALSDAIVFWHYSSDFGSEYAFVYAENYDDVKAVVTCAPNAGGAASGGPGELYAVLDTNWYLCYRTSD